MKLLIIIMFWLIIQVKRAPRFGKYGIEAEIWWVVIYSPSRSTDHNIDFKIALATENMKKVIRKSNKTVHQETSLWKYAIVNKIPLHEDEEIRSLGEASTRRKTLR